MRFPRGILIILGVSLLLSSCGGKDPGFVTGQKSVADSLIPEHKMILVLYDVHLVEASMLVERNEGVVSKDKATELYSGIFTKYGVSKEQYDFSLSYYSGDPGRLSRMYQKVIRLLEEREKTIGRGN